MTTPSTRSRPGTLPPRSATASSPRPGSTTRPFHGRQGLSVIALSAAADVGRLDASPGNLLLDGLAQQQAPWATAAATAAEGGPGEAGPVERLARAPTGPTARPAIAARLGGRADERDHAHRPEGPDKGLSLQPSMWRVPVGVGWVVRSGGSCWGRL